MWMKSTTTKRRYRMNLFFIVFRSFYCRTRWVNWLTTESSTCKLIIKTPAAYVYAHGQWCLCFNGLVRYFVVLDIRFWKLYWHNYSPQPFSTLGPRIKRWGQPCNGAAPYSGTNQIVRSRFMPYNPETAPLWWIRTRTLPLPWWGILRTHQHQVIAAVRLRRDVRDMSEKCIRWKSERVTLPPTKFWFAKFAFADTALARQVAIQILLSAVSRLWRHSRIICKHVCPEWSGSI